jgi:hypothetical protein
LSHEMDAKKEVGSYASHERDVHDRHDCKLKPAPRSQGSPFSTTRLCRLSAAKAPPYGWPDP